MEESQGAPSSGTTSPPETNPRPPAGGPSTSSKPRARSAVTKKRARRPPRASNPGYLIQETEGMLLVISDLGEGGPRQPRKRPRRPERPQRPGPPVRRARSRGEKPRASRRGPEREASLPLDINAAPEPGWGERLPVELLVRIFQTAVAEDGAVPFLCRVARVCRRWYDAASHPLLWRKVSIAPPKALTPHPTKRILVALQWLVPNRFSLLREFSLFHWKSHVPLILKAVSESCPHLMSVRLDHCQAVSTEALGALAERCSQLTSLNLKNSQVESVAVVSFLEAAGLRLRDLQLTYSSRLNAIVTTLSGGCCPELQLLEIDTGIQPNSQHFQLNIEGLQAGCPSLQVLRLLNLIWSPKPPSRTASVGPGFPHLKELCLATSAHTFVTNEALARLLCRSPHLRVLDVRGCSRLTPAGLYSLSCPEVEQLHWGLYYADVEVAQPQKDCHLLTWKWRGLRELDLSGQSFREADLEQALAAFTDGDPERSPALHSLSLKGTRVTLTSVSTLISSCPTLTYLNLSACRYMPRGMKRVYRGPEELRQCLDQLLSSTATREPT
ncbi:F-box/LRR-repeat protein 6 [Tachyglossus aculeatus]|uniref:F-box/LRR-repeat protein 6 n=1 Tax=Tachyglossus aculeatus TaxID=9261 RepID=UPI0018F555BD|nr:F-box/LRR-repeat protein 6 [Tachyglossus aculeatus]